MERIVDKEILKKRLEQFHPKSLEYKEYEEDTPMGKVLINYSHFKKEDIDAYDEGFDKELDISILDENGNKVPIAYFSYNSEKKIYWLMGALPDDGDPVENFIRVYDDNYVIETKSYDEIMKDNYPEDYKEYKKGQQSVRTSVHHPFGTAMVIFTSIFAGAVVLLAGLMGLDSLGYINLF